MCVFRCAVYVHECCVSIVSLSLDVNPDVVVFADLLELQVGRAHLIWVIEVHIAGGTLKQPQLAETGLTVVLKNERLYSGTIFDLLR